MNNKKAIKIVVYISLLTVIGFILNMIEIPYIVPWLKLDVSESMTLLGASLNPIIGIGVAFLKALLMTMTGTTTGFIGEFTLLTASLAIVFLYVVSRKFLNEILSLIVVIIGFTLVMTILNYFIITPFYFGQSYKELVSSTQTLSNGNQVSYLAYIIILYVPFNLVKITLVSVIFYPINKVLKSIPVLKI